jgi:hypothetical protein
MGLPQALTEDELRLLHRLAADAVARQPEAEAVLAGVRYEAPLGMLALRGGPLAGHDDALAEATRSLRGAAARDHADSLYRLLSSHAELPRQALELAARWWPSERLARERRRLRGLGFPGAKLRELEQELRALLELEYDLRWRPPFDGGWLGATRLTACTGSG